MVGASAWMLPSFMSCSEEELIDNTNSDKQIIIIGGGISGLAAAKKLKNVGANVTLLESHNKLGGRTRTDYSLGFAFDEGASWIHGPSGNPISPIANSAGAKTFLTDDDSLRVFDMNGKEYADSVLDSSYNSYNSALKTVINKGSKDQSFESVFKNQFPNNLDNRLWKYMLSAYLEFDYGGDISELSSNQLDDDEEFSGADLIVTNGYDKIAQYLSQGLNIVLNESVKQINYQDSKIVISTQSKSYEADLVLLTVPLGVLKNNVIKFSPALSTKKSEAISKLKMGTVNKFILVFPSVFWDSSTQYVGYTPDTKGKFNYFMNMRKINNQNALMTFAFGNYATLTESMTDSQITSEIMMHLKSIYGNGIPNPSQMLRTKWGTNSQSFGSYSFATSGTTTADFDTLAESINNRLFFAGEHTNREYRGTVHGAYLSGIREADKILKLLQ